MVGRWLPSPSTPSRSTIHAPRCASASSAAPVPSWPHAASPCGSRMWPPPRGQPPDRVPVPRDPRVAPGHRPRGLDAQLRRPCATSGARCRTQGLASHRTRCRPPYERPARPGVLRAGVGRRDARPARRHRPGPACGPGRAGAPVHGHGLAAGRRRRRSAPLAPRRRGRLPVGLRHRGARPRLRPQPPGGRRVAGPAAGPRRSGCGRRGRGQRRSGAAPGKHDQQSDHPRGQDSVPPPEPQAPPSELGHRDLLLPNETVAGEPTAGGVESPSPARRDRGTG